jgi:hypothetical protein
MEKGSSKRDGRAAQKEGRSRRRGPFDVLRDLDPEVRAAEG